MKFKYKTYFDFFALSLLSKNPSNEERRLLYNIKIYLLIVDIGMLKKLMIIQKLFT
jgi:hypothetical protein